MNLFGFIPTAAVIALLLAIASSLGGCVKPEKDPLAVYTADPKAFQLWILPF